MKISIEIDCTPEEARDFLGLPEVKAMQDEVLREVQDRMMAGIRHMDPVEVMRLWMPGMAGPEQMRDLFALFAGSKRKG